MAKMNKVPKVVRIDASISHRGVVTCYVRHCRFRNCCANHITAASERTKTGITPMLSEEHGMMFCETYNFEGELNERKKLFPAKHSTDGAVEAKDLGLQRR